MTWSCDYAARFPVPPDRFDAIRGVEQSASEPARLPAAINSTSVESQDGKSSC
jgi:hypothetical protein